MTKRYHLVKDHLSHDTIECAEALLKRARAGEIVGLAFVALYPRSDQEPDIHVCGVARKRRPMTRGFVMDLVDKLARPSE